MGFINNIDRQYQSLLQDILDNGVVKKDRTGTGTISVFGRQIRHKMSEGFPLLTTKKMPFKTIVTELLWFLRGDTNIKYLVDNGCNIWNGDAYKNYEQSILQSFDRLSNDPVIDAMPPRILSQEEFINRIKTDEMFAGDWGDLGPIYGKQWRNLNSTKSRQRFFDKPIPYDRNVDNKDGIDQIQNLINDLKGNPDSRRLMVNAWNVGELDQMVLPPCHYGFQVYTRELSLEERYDYGLNVLGYEGLLDYGHSQNDDDKILEFLNYGEVPKRAISLMWNQRSVDTGLGWGFNVASYGLLLMMLAKEVNMIPDELICGLGDCHIYSNHIEPIKEQLGREPFSLPNVILSDKIVNDISEYTLEDIRLENYQSHPTIKLPLSN